MSITAGFYPKMSEAVYHADPAPIPSLSSSCAKTLVQKSPMHAYAEHPRLGATHKDGSDEMDFGSLAHRLLLGKGSDIAELEADTWRGKEAAAFWGKAKAAGKIPCLSKDLVRAEALAGVLLGQMNDMGLGAVFDPANKEAQSEVAGFWQEGDVWCRFLVDRLLMSANHAHIFDVKTMSQSAHPRACAARIASMGYDIQRAHYIRGVEALRPDLAGRVNFTFIFVETVAPFAITPVRLDGEWSAIGQSRWERALAKWQECTATNNWPGYANDILRLEAPKWALSQEMDAGE
jgi:hypothetical protein